VVFAQVVVPDRPTDIVAKHPIVERWLAAQASVLLEGRSQCGRHRNDPNASSLRRVDRVAPRRLLDSELLLLVLNWCALAAGKADFEQYGAPVENRYRKVGE
jgi:hypothetical protein